MIMAIIGRFYTVRYNHLLNYVLAYMRIRVSKSMFRIRNELVGLFFFFVPLPRTLRREKGGGGYHIGEISAHVTVEVVTFLFRIILSEEGYGEFR